MRYLVVLRGRITTQLANSAARLCASLRALRSRWTTINWSVPWLAVVRKQPPASPAQKVLTYEYIRLEIDLGDLSELNSLGSVGWRVAAVVPTNNVFRYWALLERGPYDLPHGIHGFGRRGGGVWNPRLPPD